MNRDGLTLIEIVVAMIILTVGILGLAAGTGWMIRTTEVTQLDAQRAAALQAGIETVRSASFANIASGSVTQGEYEVTWSLAEASVNWKRMEFVIVGPGRAPGSSVVHGNIDSAVADTLEYRIARP